MKIFLFILTGLIVGGASFYALLRNHLKRQNSLGSAIGGLKSHLKDREELIGEVEGLYSQMVDLGSVRKLAKEVKLLQESLKAERGRITITQAEIETVEGRLRELEEIERELEASNLETNREYEILKKKEEELRGKNEALKTQAGLAIPPLEAVVAAIPADEEQKTQILQMRTELTESSTTIDTLLAEIHEGNDQYKVLKTRYDALDIEYAQLYEKFTVAEEGGGGDGA